jgi:hypothetical protein
MAPATIDFSAQFGGRDAAEAILPHFRALKAAARGLRVEGFPFAKLAFILRVDGEVMQFGASGAGNIDVGRGGAYLSVDIMIDRGDRDRPQAAITAALRSSADLIAAARRSARWDVDLEALQTCLIDLCDGYEKQAGTGRAGPR